MTRHPEDGERRQTPRVDLLREYGGHLITLDEAVGIQQLSPAGITLSSAIPLSPSQIHDLRLTLGDRAITLRARVVHSRGQVGIDEVTYVSGMAFVDPSPEAVEAIRAFLESLPESAER